MKVTYLAMNNYDIRAYNDFNELATEIDLLNNYLKTHQDIMSQYQINQLQQKIDLKKIRLDKYYNRVNWEIIASMEKNDAPSENNEHNLLLLKFIIISLLILIAIIYAG